MTDKLGALVLTAQIRDGMTLTILVIAAVLLGAGALIWLSPWPDRFKRRILDTYAVLCLLAWLICIGALSNV